MIIKSAIARIFLSGLYLPAVPSSTLRRVSRAVMALIPHAYPHTACIPSVSRLSMCLSLHSVLFHALSQLLSWKSQARIRGKRLISSPAQCRSLYPNSFDVRLFPTAALYATRTRFAALEPIFRAAFDYGLVYPWRALAAFAPEKVFSDLIEAVLGAIYIDTNGDLKACVAILRRFGVLE